MNFHQSDFVTPHIVNTNVSNNNYVSPKSVSPQANLNQNYGVTPSNYRLINGPSSLNSSSIPTFSNIAQYNQTLISSSVPQFTNHDLLMPTSSLLSSSSSTNNNNTASSGNINNSNFVQYHNSNNQSLSSSKILVNQIIDSFRRAKLKLIAFDFDCTIVSVHTGGQWTDTAEKLAEFVRPCFKELLAVLLKCTEFFVCVVTYSPQEELIREVLRNCLKEEQNINEYINKIIIKGNTREFVEEHGIENCYSNGKEIHLQFCRSRIFERQKIFSKEIINILDENILLLDDDVQNLKLANDYGHFAFQVNNSVQLVDILNFLKNDVKTY